MQNRQNLTISKAGANDAETLIELGISTFRDAFGPMNKREDMDMYVAQQMNPEKLTAELCAPDNHFYIAWIDKMAVGFAKMRTMGEPVLPESKHPIEIERLYVRQEYQGKSIGAALMRQCLEYAWANGHDTVWLGVWEQNDRAINFYKRRGFTLFGSHPFILGHDTQTDLLMKKDL